MRLSITSVEKLALTANNYLNPYDPTDVFLGATAVLLLIFDLIRLRKLYTCQPKDGSDSNTSN